MNHVISIDCLMESWMQLISIILAGVSGRCTRMLPALCYNRDNFLVANDTGDLSLSPLFIALLTSA